MPLSCSKEMFVALFLSLSFPVDTQACDEGNGNTYAMIACAQESEEKAKVKLDRVWAAIALSYVVRPEDPVWLALQRSQNAWETYLNAECNDYLNELFSGGSIRAVMIIHCRANLMIKRYCSLYPPNPLKEYLDRRTCLKAG